MDRGGFLCYNEKSYMQIKNTNINNFVVQSVGILIIVAIAVMNAYPLPALAFAEQITHRPVEFPRETYFEVTASAYSSTPDQTDASPFITASGTKVRYGIIAANFLPIGTTVQIGEDTFIVEDRMNSRYNGKYYIDIWMPSREAAQAFGVQTLFIELIAYPER
jgi:3D (Asp-Asp-Asp) domain-containing protein